MILVHPCTIHDIWYPPYFEGRYYSDTNILGVKIVSWVQWNHTTETEKWGQKQNMTFLFLFISLFDGSERYNSQPVSQLSELWDANPSGYISVRAQLIMESIPVSRKLLCNIIWCSITRSTSVGLHIIGFTLVLVFFCVLTAGKSPYNWNMYRIFRDLMSEADTRVSWRFCLYSPTRPDSNLCWKYVRLMVSVWRPLPPLQPLGTIFPRCSGCC